MISTDVPMEITKLAKKLDVEFMEIEHESSNSESESITSSNSKEDFEEKIDIAKLKVEPIDYKDITDVSGQVNVLPIQNLDEETIENSKDTIKKECIQEEIIKENQSNQKFQDKDAERTCSFCSKILSNKYKLKRHVNSVHKNSKVLERTCKICGKTICDKWTLKAHIDQVHNNVRKFKCEVCLQTFKVKKSLRKHQENHQKNLQCTCDICGKTFRDKKFLITHQKSVHDFFSNKQIDTDVKHQENHQNNSECTCGMCGKTFPEKSFLIRHLKTVHDFTDNQIFQFQCDSCNKIFVKKQHLEKHLKIRHQKNMRTRGNSEKLYSDYSTSNEKNNISEMKKSIEVCNQILKQVLCDICNKTFTSPEKLKIHVTETHQAEPVQCKLCDEVFESRKSLQDHSNSNHNSAIEKCNHCSKWFTKNSMKKHDCQKISKIEKKLKQRLLTSYELNTKCKFCPKAFGSENKLRMHLKLSCKEFKKRIELLKSGQIHSLLEILS